MRRRGTDFWINTSCKQANACEINKAQNQDSLHPENIECDPAADHSVCR